MPSGQIADVRDGVQELACPPGYKSRIINDHPCYLSRQYVYRILHRGMTCACHMSTVVLVILVIHVCSLEKRYVGN
jgi:hypothetical protein